MVVSLEVFAKLLSLFVVSVGGMEGIGGGGFADPKSPKSSSSSSETVAKIEVGSGCLGVDVAIVLARSATLEAPKLQKPKPPVLLPPGVRATGGARVDVGVVYSIVGLGVFGTDAVVTEGLNEVLLLGVVPPRAGNGALVASPIPEKASPTLAEAAVTGEALYWGIDMSPRGVKGASSTSTRLPKASPTDWNVELLFVETFREGVEGVGIALLVCGCDCE